MTKNLVRAPSPAPSFGQSKRTATFFVKPSLRQAELYQERMLMQDLWWWPKALCIRKIFHKIIVKVQHDHRDSGKSENALHNFFNLVHLYHSTCTICLQISQSVFDTRVAEVVRGPPPKSLDSDENFKPEHMLFCRKLRFLAIYALFGDHWAKKCLFESKTVFLGQEVHYYMVCIAYFTELNSKIWDYAQKRRICRENCNYALDERFHGHFCPRRKPTKSCHPADDKARQ